MRALVGELIRRRLQAEATCQTLTRVLEATSDGFVALDAEWRYTYVNAHAGQMFGRDPESLIGKHIWTEFPEGLGQPFHLECERAVADGQPRQIEAYYASYGRWFESRIFPYAGGLAIFFQDVTARRLAEDRLRESEQRLQQAEKMEAVGRLAGGIAHDFNNLLTIVQSCATFLARDLPESSALRADVQEIQHATHRATELTQQLLAFSRKQILQPRRLDVNRHVVGFVAMLRRVIGHGIAIETELAADTWPVFADPGQIERVLMNLGLNARDAMPAGGTMLVRTENVVLSHDTGGVAAGAYVALTVDDTGTGIDPDVLPHIFEPFVTTKPVGVGTGLGLATVHGIIEQTGGAIRVSSTPGRGSRFSVFLPRADDETITDAAVA
jgi:PAS domain S-box-containing protein